MISERAAKALKRPKLPPRLSSMRALGNEGSPGVSYLRALGYFCGFSDFTLSEFESLGRSRALDFPQGSQISPSRENESLGGRQRGRNPVLSPNMPLGPPLDEKDG